MREGVIKTLKIKQEDFRALYDNRPDRFTVSHPGEIRENSATPSLLIPPGSVAFRCDAGARRVELATLLGKVHAAQQILKARVGAKAVVVGIHLDLHHVAIVDREALL